MKKFLLVGIIVLTSIYRPVFSQSCCKMSATQQFGQLTMNEKFAAAHEAPLPLHLESLNGTMITYKCSDGTIAGAL